MKLTGNYVVSGIVFSFLLAVFLGYLFSGVPISSPSYSWVAWTIIFGSAFVVYTHVPKPKWLWKLNSVVLLLIGYAIFFIASENYPSVKENLFGVRLFNVFTGSILYIPFIVCWIWHTVAAMGDIEIRTS